MNPTRELDEDPDAAVAVITGRHRGSVPYALICLADAIRHGDHPQSPVLCSRHSVPMWWDEASRLYRCGEPERGCGLTVPEP